MTDYFPEQTLAYKTFTKHLIVDALTEAFSNHPDPMLQGTKVDVDFPRDEASYPAVVIRFYEREITNAGIGHKEYVTVVGETPGSDEIDVTTSGPNRQIQLNWDQVDGATGYRVYRANNPGIFDGYWEIRNKTQFVDNGHIPNRVEAQIPTIDTAPFSPPNNITGAAVPADGDLLPGSYRYKITAIAPSQTWAFDHYFYKGDIEFAIYALTSYDRDLIADTIVQALTMGEMEDWTNRFMAQIYTDQPRAANVAILSFNKDQVQGYGEQQSQPPWGQEDTLIYTTAYRVQVWGEYYNLPPKIPFGVIQKVLLYPYIAGYEDVPGGDPNNTNPWEP